MLPALMIVAVLLGQTAAAESQQPRPIGSRGQTDQTVNVQKGTRVVIDECSGEVVVKTWDRDAVRVRADHSRSTKIQVTPRDQVLHITREGRGAVDYDLTVPTWIGLSMEGTYCYVDVEGLAGNLSATTVEGDIVLRALTGTATVESIEGTIKVEGGRGRIQARTTDGDIEVTKAAGELLLESIDGEIHVTETTPTAMEITTVDGDITFNGTFQGNGRYRFETHDGTILIALPDNTSATFVVRRSEPSQKIDSTLPLKAAADGQRGRRRTFTLGGGSAQVEIDTFDGDVKFRRPGEIKKKE